MPDELLPAPEPIAPAPRESDVYRTCDFCGCKLTKRGEVMQLGEKAREFQKHDQAIEDRNARIAALESETRDLKDKIMQLEGRRRSTESIFS